jgi:DnaJ-class molecular chaperone
MSEEEKQQPVPEPDDVCPVCDGDGTVYGHLCKACGGLGFKKAY